eukprot:gb/GEZN01005563.1/.p1 GENE.gb/GEZN01005563.1/~~gb/GEZN01005563.1/.p1  ORF type:complete len:493 (-),score=118.65 gb/GEZN01005563.1/:177-1655(-)
MKKLGSWRSGKSSTGPTEEQVSWWHFAAGSGDLEKIKELIEAKVDINLPAPKMHNSTALRLAAKGGHMGIVRELVAQGADMKGALRSAVWFNQEEAARLLVVCGSDVNELDELNRSPAWCAAHRGFTELLKLLLLSGADPNIAGKASDFYKTAKGLKGLEHKSTPLQEAEILPNGGLREACSEILRTQAKELAAKRNKLSGAEPANKGTSAVAEKKAPYLMLSYQWDRQALVLQVKEELQRRGWRVWIDTEQMKGSTLAAMAEAVEGAAAVLMFMSSSYQTSDNCRLEAEYCFLQKKPYFPIMVDDPATWKPTGWLGILLGSKLWYDLSHTETDEALKAKLDQLNGSLADTVQLAYDAGLAAGARDSPSLLLHSSVPSSASSSSTPANSQDTSAESLAAVQEWLFEAKLSSLQPSFRQAGIDQIALAELGWMQVQHFPSFLQALAEIVGADRAATATQKQFGLRLRFSHALREKFANNAEAETSADGTDTLP